MAAQVALRRAQEQDAKLGLTGSFLAQAMVPSAVQQQQQQSPNCPSLVAPSPKPSAFKPPKGKELSLPLFTYWVLSFANGSNRIALFRFRHTNEDFKTFLSFHK
ncbi:hypothetical protein CEXT_711601 [Caerostris extrusa]|uniref:Uncharacterized protein n=1 Tax=Caerostris extrusa TaxID=172846 RepID=A0AAV4N5V0_CAEEX|nr:hypothetical protein CEXT_711601 [Caerostris extrusa]